MPEAFDAFSLIVSEAFEAFSFMVLEAFLALSFNASVFEGEVAFSTLLAAVLILFSTGVDISEFSRFVGSTIFAELEICTETVGNGSSSGSLDT